MSIAPNAQSKLWSPSKMSFASEDNHDIFRYTFFPKSGDEEKQKVVTKPKPKCRLPKIVINKKNFVFKEAIEQIHRDNRKRSESRRKLLKSLRNTRVLSEEARHTNSHFEVENPNFEKEREERICQYYKNAKKRKSKMQTKLLKSKLSEPALLSIVRK